MQTKNGLRTGSMMSLEDSEREVKVENRDMNVFWCFAIPNAGMKPEEGFYLRAKRKHLKLLTFYKLDRDEYSAFQMDCLGKRCTLVTLPPGITPRDLEIQSR